MDKITENAKKDSRKNFADFYETFDLNNVFSKPMANFVLSGKREAKNQKVVMNFLSRCVSIYQAQTQDYSNPTVSTKEMFDNYNYNHSYGITAERLQESTGRELLAIKRAITDNPKSINSKSTNDVRDALKYDLIHHKRSLDKIFENVPAYKELERRLMRVEVGNGLEFLTVYDIADETGIEVEVLQDLSKACHHKDDYENVYDKLVKLQKAYELGM